MTGDWSTTLLLFTTALVAAQSADLSTNGTAVVPNCISWRQTGGCSPNGPREPTADLPCDVWIDNGHSGFCECENGRKVGNVSCIHQSFKCADECSRTSHDHREAHLAPNALVEHNRHIKEHMDGKPHHHRPGHRDPYAEQESLTVFSVLMFFMLLSQLLLHFWKKKSPRTYQNVTLAGLWAVPMVLSAMSLYWRFLSVWLLFSAVTGYLLYLVTRKPMAVTTPRMVYRWFLRVYRITYNTGYVGYLTVMCEFLGLRPLLGLPPWLTQQGTLLLFYGLYFGVLGRDCAEVCADLVSSRLGYRKRSEDAPRATQHYSSNICALCGEELRALRRMEDEGSEAPRPEEALFSLECKHDFHESCIRGWAIVGKKDTCPSCSEKVSLRSVIGTSPWQTQSLLWANLLDALRYLIVWNPIILIAVQLVINGVGIHRHPMPS